MTTRFKDFASCLDCGRGVDAASRADPAEPEVKPRAGDVAICIYCGHVMAYADDVGGLRPLTGEEIVEIAGDPVIVAMQNAITRHRKATDDDPARA